jgi:hypothetical protein
VASKCRYCGEEMRGNKTREHLIPMWFVRKTGIRFSDDVWEMNLLPVCLPCNQAKGPKDPLSWLTEMPSEFHAYKLATHMVKMGFGMGDVFGALRDRSR